MADEMKDQVNKISQSVNLLAQRFDQHTEKLVDTNDDIKSLCGEIRKDRELSEKKFDLFDRALRGDLKNADNPGLIKRVGSLESASARFRKGVNKLWVLVSAIIVGTVGALVTYLFNFGNHE